MRRSPPPVASLGAALVLLLLGCPLAAAQCTEAGQTVVFGTGNVALATGYNTSDGWAARALSWSCGCHSRKTLTCTLKNAANYYSVKPAFVAPSDVRSWQARGW